MIPEVAGQEQHESSPVTTSSQRPPVATVSEQRTKAMSFTQCTIATPSARRTIATNSLRSPLSTVQLGMETIYKNPTAVTKPGSLLATVPFGQQHTATSRRRFLGFSFSPHSKPSPRDRRVWCTGGHFGTQN